jgi:hypothetical protein
LRNSKLAQWVITLVLIVATSLRLGTSRALAQYIPIPNYTGIGAGAEFRGDLNNHLSGATAIAPRLVPLPFVQLPAEEDGQLYWCSDCQQASRCVGGGAGALAIGAEGQWSCSSGGGAPGGSQYAIETNGGTGNFSGSIISGLVQGNGNSGPIGAYLGTACATNNYLTALTGAGAGSCSQPNFSSLAGNISVSQMNGGSGAASNSYWRGDGTWATPPGAGPGGSTAQLQYNNSGSFGGAANTTISSTGAIAGAGTSGQNTITSYSVNNLLNVLNYGAACNGTTNDTTAIQAAITAAEQTHAKGILFPWTGNLCVVSSLNLSGLSQGFRLVGQTAPKANTNVPASGLLCEGSSLNYGNCIDTTGSWYFSIEHLNIQNGANGPAALILLAKTAASSSQAITFDDDSFINYTGKYVLYDYGGEVFSSAHTSYAGGTAATIDISVANTAGVSSSYQTVLTPPTSMTVTSFEDDVFNTLAGSEGIQFDVGSGSAAGQIASVKFDGGYINQSSTFAFNATGTSTLPGVSGLTINNLRDEPQGGISTMGFFQSAVQIENFQMLNDTFANSVQPTVAIVQFNQGGTGSAAGGIINIRPGDGQGTYPTAGTPVISCANGVQNVSFASVDAAGGGNLTTACANLNDVQYSSVNAVINVQAPVCTVAGTSTILPMGAKGNSSTDDTAAIQNAILCASGMTSLSSGQMFVHNGHPRIVLPYTGATGCYKTNQPLRLFAASLDFGSDPGGSNVSGAHAALCPAFAGPAVIAEGPGYYLPTYTTSLLSGSGNAFVGNGSSMPVMLSDWLNSAKVNFASNSAFGISMTVKLSALGDGSLFSLQSSCPGCQNRPSGQGQEVIGFSVNSSGQTSCQIATTNNGTVGGTSSDTGFTLNTAHTMEIDWNGSDFYCFRDGTLVVGPVAATGSILTGVAAGGSLFFTMAFPDVEVGYWPDQSFSDGTNEPVGDFDGIDIEKARCIRPLTHLRPPNRPSAQIPS